MTNKYKKEREDINRRVYGKKTFEKLKEIGKKKGLRNVDRYKKADRDILIEHLIKGKQLEDESKNVILEQARNSGLKVNASMKKEVLIKKVKNPELEDLNNDRLRELAKKGGVPLKDQMTDKAIIQRLRDPTRHYTKQSLKEVAKNNNVEFPRNISLQELKNLLGERGLITTTPIKAQEANLWVSFRNIPETIRRVVKKKPRTLGEK